MFVDELKITAKAGDGGPGVVRWRREKYKPKAGPAGGNGGQGGDVYVVAVADMNQLAKYTGNNHFEAMIGTPGTNQSQHGAAGEDRHIAIPVGSKVTDVERRRTFVLTELGQSVKILKGGHGGLGNEHFKSSTNVSPTESTLGTPGEAGTFLIEVALAVAVGLVGLPNAGKSTLLNTLTNAKSTVGAYPFTTLEPHLGSFYGYAIADIPGLIEGAASGKGLGHKFLRHIARTRMLLHLISLESPAVRATYETVRQELTQFDAELATKEEWIILTKKDLVTDDDSKEAAAAFADLERPVFVVSEQDPESIASLEEALRQRLATT